VTARALALAGSDLDGDRRAIDALDPRPASSLPGALLMVQLHLHQASKLPDFDAGHGYPVRTTSRTAITGTPSR
jgi:hypothetical protein